MLRVWLLFLAFATYLVGESLEVHRGSIAVLDIDEGVDVRVRGSSDGLASIDQLPLYLGGLLSIRAQAEKSTFLKFASGVDLAFEGEGTLSVERFDMSFVDPESLSRLDAVETQLVLNLRKGRIFLDASAANESDQLLIELPFGRAFAQDSVWMIEVDYDYRSKLYDFTLYCFRGSVRLLDRNRQSYVIYGGQRLSGAGVYSNPAVEIGDSTGDTSDAMLRFQAYQESVAQVSIERDLFLVPMVHLAGLSEENRELPTEPGSDSTSESLRPVVIDPSLPPSPLVPYRGGLY